MGPRLRIIIHCFYIIVLVSKQNIVLGGRLMTRKCRNQRLPPPPTFCFRTLAPQISIKLRNFSVEIRPVNYPPMGEILRCINHRGRKSTAASVAADGYMGPGGWRLWKADFSRYIHKSSDRYTSTMIFYSFISYLNPYFRNLNITNISTVEALNASKNVT